MQPGIFTSPPLCGTLDFSATPASSRSSDFYQRIRAAIIRLKRCEQGRLLFRQGLAVMATFGLLPPSMDLLEIILSQFVPSHRLATRRAAIGLATRLIAAWAPQEIPEGAMEALYELFQAAVSKPGQYTDFIEVLAQKGYSKVAPKMSIEELITIHPEAWRLQFIQERCSLNHTGRQSMRAVAELLRELPQVDG